MDSKKKRTLDVYKQVGAEMYLLRQIYSKLLTDSSAVLRVPDQKRLWRAIDIINVVRSHVEDNMFADHTELPHEYIHVFYGRTDGMSGLDAVDKEIIDLAKSVADSCFVQRGAGRWERLNPARGAVAPRCFAGRAWPGRVTPAIPVAMSTL